MIGTTFELCYNGATPKPTRMYEAEMTRSKRFELLEQRPINQEAFVHSWPEVGLIVADSPADPQPSLRIENGRVIEMEWRRR